jgi:hypothetical protein
VGTVSDLVTMHVWRIAPQRVPSAFAAAARDPRRVRALASARFAKLLGTSSGFGLRGADLTRWVLLVSWTSADAASTFADSAVVQRWRARSRESWSAELLPLASRGRWSRRSPFEGAASNWDGPVAALTHARLAPRHAVTFWRSVAPVAADLQHRSGLRAAFGIAEVPLGVQGTFSLWRDAAALDEFAYRGESHREVIRQTALHRWYTEELFARFGVLSSAGRLGGHDPLAASS